MLKQRVYFSLCQALLFAAAVPAVDLQASLSRHEVKVGESFAYRIVLKAHTTRLPRILLPEFKHFRLLSQNSQQNYLIKNGHVEAVLVVNLELLAVQGGEFTLPSVSVKYKGKVYHGPLLKIKVKKGDMPLLPPPAETGAVSL